MECFTIWSEDIVGRIDPYFYFSKVKTEKILSNTKYPLVRFGDTCLEIRKGIFNLKSKDYKLEGVPFIRISDIQDGGLNSSNIAYISEEANEREKRTQLKPGDLVFAKIGTIDRVGILPSTYSCYNMSQNIIGVKLSNIDRHKINPMYLRYFFLLKLGKKQLVQQATFQVQLKLTLDALRDIKIPLPPLETQKRIIQLMDNAYEIKKQKETEAQQLIDTINDYVLEELSIKLPELKDEMCYVVNADEVKNNRCDAYYYQPKFEEVVEALENGKYNVVLFDVLIKDIKNGVEIRKYSEEGYRYLRVTDLGEFGINDFDPRFVSVEKIPEKILLGDNSFLISRSGSLGLVSVVEEKIKNAILSSHIFKVDLDYNIVLPKYLESYFRSTVGQIQFFRNNNGGIVPEINQLALRSLWIILPPLQIQNKIAEEVKQRMQKAEQLHKEAKEVLEEAKERAERIILGDEEI